MLMMLELTTENATKVESGPLKIVEMQKVDKVGTIWWARVCRIQKLARFSTLLNLGYFIIRLCHKQLKNLVTDTF